MSGYVFLSNSTKPSDEQQNSREDVKLTNVSRPCLQAALDMGYDVYFGVNRANPEELKCELPVKLYDSHTYRSITAFKDNKIAYDNLKKVVKDNSIEVIHCNTPIGGMIGRIVGKKCHVNKVIYTVHGFHFYKGAPFLNQTVLKWAEQIMAHWTDAIITMNQEDYEAAQKFKLRNKGKVYFVPGVGIDTSQYHSDKQSRSEKRKELGFFDDDILLISMGDLIKRKNYPVAIEAVAKVENPKLHYLICGQGPEKESLEKQTKDLRVTDRIHFLDFRTDVKDLLNASDIFMFTTLQEGLPRSMMEAMASGLPCIASRIRGNVDLLEDGKGGYLCGPINVDAYAESISKLAEDVVLRNRMGKFNRNHIKRYDVSVVERKIRDIYTEILN